MSGWRTPSSRRERWGSTVSKLYFPAGKSSGIAVMDGAFDTDLMEKLYLFASDAMDDIGQPGITMGGVMPDVKATTDIRLSEMDTWTGDWSLDALKEVGYDMKELDAALAARITELLVAYVEEFPHLGGVAMQDSGYQIQRYKAGRGFYSEHVDANPEIAPERILALVIYLNDVEEGGETFFRQHGCGVRPGVGRVAIFPAHWMWPHESLVPLTGDKYIISTFIESPNIHSH